MASRVSIVNQTDLVNEIDSSNIEGAVIIDFGVNIIDIVDIVNIVDLGVVTIEMKITRTRDRPKEE